MDDYLNEASYPNDTVFSNPIVQSIYDKQTKPFFISYYETNKYELRSEELRRVFNIARVIQARPFQKILLIGFTDSRGSDVYNHNLSFKRAKKLQEYLVYKGIDSNRIKVLGYGGNNIRNNCINGVNCSDFVHGENRRVEVYIIK